MAAHVTAVSAFGQQEHDMDANCLGEKHEGKCNILVRRYG